jgi:cytochrome c oxidase subunit 1
MGSRACRVATTTTDEFTLYHQISTVGAMILGIGIVVMMWNLYMSLSHGKKAGSNPWGSPTLEWQTPSPAPHHNFDRTPLVCDPYDLNSVKYNPETDDYERDLDYVREHPDGPHGSH